MRFLTLSTIGFVAILWLKVIYPASSGLPDTDFFWHLEYGRWILEHGQLPPGDTFSWTHTGQPYLLTQWLGEVAIAFAYQLGGPLGTTLLATAVAGIAIGFAWRSAARYVESPVALTLAVLCNAILIVMAMRPQMFSFAATAIAIHLLFSWRESGKFTSAAMLVVLLAVWTNLHGAFVIGMLLLGINATGSTAEWILTKRPAGLSRFVRNQWLLLIAGLAATGINPYGFTALTNVFMIGGLKSALVISEWKPVLLTTATGWFYLMYAVPFIAMLVISRARLPITQNLLVAFALLFAIQANRQVAIGGAIMAPMLAMLLARTEQYATMRSTISDPSRPAVTVIAVALFFASALPIISFGQVQMARNLDKRYPVHAVAFMEEHALTSRVLADTVEASYLIHRHIPVYIDGRMDLYRDRFFFRWWLAERGAPGWEKVVQEAHPEVILLRRTAALRQLLLATGTWKLAYDDARYSVLLPQAHPLPAVAAVTVDYQAADGGPSLNFLE